MSAAGHGSVGWLASAGIVATTISDEFPAIHELLPKGFGPLAVSNDAVPMLFAPPPAGRGAVVVAGTRSGFLGGDGDTVVQLGGHDYLGADQGSAFDIGLQGRAARLAPTVIRCWLDHDDVAGAVLTVAVDALVAGAARVRQRLGLTATDGTVLTGGLITGCADFAAAVHLAMERACGPHQITVCTGTAATVLACARRLAAAGDRSLVNRAHLGRYVWLLEPQC